MNLEFWILLVVAGHLLIDLAPDVYRACFPPVVAEFVPSEARVEQAVLIALNDAGVSFEDLSDARVLDAHKAHEVAYHLVKQDHGPMTLKHLKDLVRILEAS